MKKRNKFKILNFINSHSDWRRILTAPPYNLMIRDFDGYTLIKYNQLFSDFKQEMVREARGFIVKKQGRKYVPVCLPFTKFFCAGDPNAKKDLKKLFHKKQWCVEEKIDGSLIKLWFDNEEWHISTSGTISAKDAPVQFEMHDIKNYEDLFMYASKDKIEWNKLDKHYTYLFELVGLENKVIVPYEQEDIYYLGRRHNYTFYEIPYEKDDCVGVEKCKRPKYKCVTLSQSPKKTIKALQEEVNNLTQQDEHFEGYVISDRSLKTRVKMKSLKYLELFTQKGNGVFSEKKILLTILDHKDDDVLSAFPEYTPQFNVVKNLFNQWIEKIKQDINYMQSCTWETRKDFAEWAQTTTCPNIMYQAYKQKDIDDEWLESKIHNLTIYSLLKSVGVEKDV